MPIFLSRTSRGWIERSWKPAMIVLLMVVPLVISCAYLGFSLTMSRAHIGWEELGEQVKEVRETMDSDQVYLAGPYHFIVNSVAYFVMDDVSGCTLMFRGYEYENLGVDTDYEPWVPLADLVGKDIIFVDEMDNPDDFETPVSYWEEKLPPYFEAVEGPIIFTEEKKGRDFRTFYIFKCYGFKGPDEDMDVRGEIREYVQQQ